MRELERDSARVRARLPTAKDSGSGIRRQLPRYGKQYLGQATSYFFYDFPADQSAKDLWYCFWSFGKVADVYIPAKRDRRGRRFGFVRMLNVSNVREMERKLNQIKIHSYHLKVKLAENMKKGREGTLLGNHKQLEKQWIRRDSKVTPGKTYAQVVAGDMGSLEQGQSSNNGVQQGVAKKGNEAMEDAGEEELKVTPEISQEKASGPETVQVLNFIPKNEEVAWLKRSMVAEVRSLDLVKRIQNSLDVEGVLVSVALLGGRQIILVDNSEGGLEEFLNRSKDLVELWFEWIKPCSLSTVSSLCRLVWLRLNGVPLKAWSERCFTELGNIIGEVILVDEDTRSKSFLCEGRVLILSAEKRKISTTICLRVDGEDFPIAVSEEEWRMDPDWWLAGERRNPATQPSSEYSSSDDEEGDDGYSDLNLNFNGNGFLCGDGGELAEDHAVTDLVLYKELSRQAELQGEEVAGFVGRNGLDEIGLDKGNQVGPGVVGNGIGLEEAQPGCGSIFKSQASSTQLQQMALTGKKRRTLREIYAGGAGADETMQRGASWITARTKSRRDRRMIEAPEEERPNLQQESCSVSDGCIQHRNGIIRRQLETKEVREIFELGQRLGIQCQHNDEEVISRLAALEARDEINSRGA
ncbi:hypothetical protein SLEP1_g34360 [Rubroshorea leprosula]|uniref:RRM domain-containing protein n=1 Tax=Rubroshorea leprosula TaxID=152421 RepID=A0AAV5KJN1_9ROSI|nr:hypothetical protein SLEP1_g34360 [Rubroshorea leprosula]